MRSSAAQVRQEVLIGTYVLVHGDRIWRPVQVILEAAGHVTYAPGLTGYGNLTHIARPDLRLSDHIAEIASLIVTEDLRDVVLVGHSYGGMVIAGAADQVPDRLRHLVYVDALAPRDGQSALDITPQARRDEILDLARTQGGGVWVPPRQPGPNAGPGTPLGLLTERLTLTNAAAAKLPRTFVFCTSPPAPMIPPSAERARTEPGWTYHELACGHIVQNEAPQKLAIILLDALSAERS